MDLIFFGGQSNMEGQTEGVPLDTAPVDGALEYRYKTREYVPLAHPVGEGHTAALSGELRLRLAAARLLPHICALQRQ